MNSEMGSSKLHELIGEKWERFSKRHEATKHWLEYLGRMGLKRTRVKYESSNAPRGGLLWTILFPDHDEVFFVLDPLDSLHFISIPKEIAFKIMVLGEFP